MTGMEVLLSKNVLLAIVLAGTYFFRNNDQFRAFAEVVVPERMRANSASRRLRILSAGCASGEEAYTLAIILRTIVPDPTWQVTIRAVEIRAVVNFVLGFLDHVQIVEPPEARDAVIAALDAWNAA